MGPAKKVLVVEDDPHIQGLLTQYLQDRGFEVLCSTDGWDCLWEIVVKRPDIIIMDIEMPKISGLDAMELMRASHLIENIPIIVASALNDETTISKANALGADEYMLKPYSFEDMHQKIKSLIMTITPNELHEILRSLPQKDSPVHDWSFLAENKYRAFNAYGGKYQNREICVLIRKDLSLEKALALPDYEAEKKILVLAKTRKHWKGVWPSPDYAAAKQSLLKAV